MTRTATPSDCTCATSFKEGELQESATTEESSVVQQEGSRQVRRKVRLYNLDAIISVGYRVNSIRGTQFRIWATRVLRDHVLQGYTINQARLKDLNRAVRLIADTTQRRDLSGDEAKALLAVVGDYHRALGLLDDYDHQRIGPAPARRALTRPLEYDDALRIRDPIDSRKPSRRKGRSGQDRYPPTVPRRIRMTDGTELN